MSKDLDLYVGIDPGLDGAVAVIDVKRSLISVQDTPTITVKKGKKQRRLYLESQMATILENVRASGHVVCVGLENIHAMPGQGTVSMFNMGVGFGLWLGLLAALRLPLRRIEPAKWKREMGIAVGSDKAQSIVRALQIFPLADQLLKRKKDDGRADALLLAAWLLQTKGGA